MRLDQFPPATVMEMKAADMIITTNGVDVANPVDSSQICQRPRVRHAGLSERPGGNHPAALAGRLALAFGATRQFRPLVRLAAIALASFWAARHFSGPAQNSAGSSALRLAGTGVAPARLAKAS